MTHTDLKQQENHTINGQHVIHACIYNHYHNSNKILVDKSLARYLISKRCHAQLL